MRECEICGGRGRIRLPRYARISAVFDTSAAPNIGATVAEFPCPECHAESASFERIDVVETIAGAATDIKDERFHEHVRKRLAYDLALELLTRGLITFERGRPDTYNMTVPWKATVAVVAPRHVATMEARIAQRQFDVASELIAMTIEQVENWGSHYSGRTGGSVGKWQAIDWLRDAFKRVREARVSRVTPAIQPHAESKGADQ